MPALALLALSAFVQAPPLNDQLVEAVRHNDVAVAKRLLDEGAKADYVEQARTPVLLEAFRAPTSYRAQGSIEPMVLLLLSRGAKADAIDGFGWCALTLADGGVSMSLIEALVSKGADPNRVAMHGDPAICRFAGFGRLDVVRYLVDHGAKVDMEGYFGETALGEAARAGRLDLVRYLREKGANPRYRGYAKQTVLNFAVQCERDNTPVLEYLAAEGLKANTKTDYGLTPLHSVALWGNVANAKWLLAHGVDARVKDRQGKTALDYALMAKKQGSDRSAMIALLKRTKE